MSRDRKLSVLESLLERVRGRAAGPRVSASAHTPERAAASAHAPERAAASPPAADEVRLEGADAVQAAAASPGTPAPPPATPAPLHLEPPPARGEIISEPPLAEADDEGPPSAPRLREGIVDEEEQEQDQDFQDDEGPTQTAPPESGRQHVAAPVPPDAQEAADDLDMDISITVAEASPEPPAVAAISAPPERPPPAPPVDVGLDMGGPLPRLAFVSEPEIELHVTRPPPPRTAASTAVTQPAPAPTAAFTAVTQPPAPAASEPPADAPTSAVIPIPTGEPLPPQPLVRAPEPAPATAPEPEPARVAAPEPVATSLSELRAPAPPSTPPPVRLMAQPPADAGGGAAPAPVEVWASTHAPAVLRGQVASFVGQNVAFAPKSFGELLDASLELGES